VGEGRASSNRVSVYDAAEALGVTVDAIRKRIQRGTIAHERDEEGRVWVILDTSSKIHDTDQDTYRTVGAAEFIEEMRERIQDLREQLAAERQANEENRRIIAALTQRIPEIEAPPSQEPAEAPEMAEDEQQGRGPVIRFGPQQPAEEPTEPRSWWRRVFGG
jgi:hypothetical protein